MGKKLTNNDFIERSRIVHNNFYDYVEEYRNSHTPIKISCPIHGEFEQKPYSHLQGYGCSKCGINKASDSNRKVISNFIEDSNKIHNNFYSYDNGDFLQRPNAHLKGHGCKKCYVKENKPNDKFIEQAIKKHNNKYIYNDEYKGAHTLLRITCPIHGDFSQTPNSHLRGRGCPSCQWSNSSKMENDWLDLIGIKKEYRNKKIIIDDKVYKVDAYVPETNTIYEFYGDFWHGNPNKNYKSELNYKAKETFVDLYNKTINRENFLKSLGYNLVSIWEDDYLKQYKNKK